jgi:hypothetical protein
VTASTADVIADQLGEVVDRLGTSAGLDQARAVLDAPPEVLERLWQTVSALAAHRKVDPELRRDLLRVAAKVAPNLVPQIKKELDEAVPSAVLEAHQDQLVLDRPSLGAFPRRDTLEAPTVDEWLKEDPRRLRGVVLEVARFCGDDRLVVESVLGLAETLGVDGHLAADIIGYALRDARHPQAVVQ